MPDGRSQARSCLAGQPLRIGSATAITPSVVLLVNEAKMIRLLHKQHAMSDRNFFLNKFKKLGFIQYDGELPIKVHSSLLRVGGGEDV